MATEHPTDYFVVDSFTVKTVQVIVLDRDYDFLMPEYVLIDGVKYKYLLNSIRKWIVLQEQIEIKDRHIRFVS